MEYLGLIKIPSPNYIISRQKISKIVKNINYNYFDFPNKKTAKILVLKLMEYTTIYNMVITKFTLVLFYSLKNLYPFPFTFQIN